MRESSATPEETQGHFHLSAYPGVEYLAPEAACCTRIKGIEHSADTFLVCFELKISTLSRTSCTD